MMNTLPNTSGRVQSCPPADATQIINKLIANLVGLRLAADSLNLSLMAGPDERAIYTANTRNFVREFSNIIADHTGVLVGDLADYTSDGNACRQKAEDAIRAIFHDEIIPSIEDAAELLAVEE